MPSNYTGNSSAVEAPSAAPGANVAPIVSIPSDTTDDMDTGSIAQAFKVLADFITWCTKVLGGTLTGKALALDGTGGAAATPPAGALAVSAASLAVGTSSALARGVLYADMVPVAMGQAICDTGPSFWFSGGCLGITRTGTGIYSIQLGGAVPDVRKAMIMATVVTDGVTGYCTTGFIDTTHVGLEVFTPANAPHDGGVVNFVVYAMLS